MWLDSNQPPGSGDVAITRMPPGAWLSPPTARCAWCSRTSRVVGLSTMVSVTIGARWGRTRFGTTTGTTTNAASVTPIAGRGRRTSMPTVTPSANAKTA